jgi:hypothetical protein
MRPLVLKNIIQIELPLSTGRYLVVAGLHKIPPHVALIESGKYFALTVKGPEFHQDANRLISRLINKGTNVLLIKIKSSELTSDPSPFFSQLGSLTENQSCLDPILDFLKKEININPEKSFLHGLIEELQKLDLIESIYMNRLSLSGELELQRYDRQAINKRIRELRKD